MERVKSLQDFLDSFTKKTYGRSNSESISGGVCVICGQPATEFKDELSKKEYSISGMCQQCQDETFR
jgi:uncharacterized CHY-type Zn-finger protein